MSSVPKTLGEAYEAWWGAVRPAGAGEIQTEEMRRAFWTGATCAFWLVVKASEADTKHAFRTMDAIHAEISAFEAEMAALAAAAERSH